MSSEKNFIAFIVITVIITVGYPAIVRKFFPNLMPEPDAPPPIVREIMLDDGSDNQTQVISSVPTEQVMPIESRKEKLYTLQNNELRVVVSTPSGTVSRIELLRFLDPETQQPTVLVDNAGAPASVFQDTGWLEAATDTAVTAADGQTVRISYTFADGAHVYKIISLYDEQPALTLRYEVTNTADWPQSRTLQVIGAMNVPVEQGIAKRFNESVIYDAQKKKLHKYSLNSLNKKQVVQADVQFAGLCTRYFSVLLAPQTTVDYAFARNISTDAGELIPQTGVTVRIPEANYIDFVLYAGPTAHDELKSFNLGFEQVRGTGFWAGLSEILLLLLHLFYNVLRNYGLAVIALSLVINGALSPLTIKSYTAMKDMQQLQPHMEKLREQYKDNPQKLNKEIMELYKKHRVNPASGCLPLLLQMPIFFSLYNVLMRAVELRGASFLWITDLSGPDALFVLPAAAKSFPLIGSVTQGNINALPLIMIGLQIIQQQLTKTAQQTEQQRMMAVLSPVLIGVLFYNFPSGLVLYFLTNSVFSFFIQLRIRNT